MLIAMINQYGSTWPEILPTVLQKLRGVVNDSTGKSPYEMMFGRVPRMAMDLMLSDLKDINLPNKKQADPAKKMVQVKHSKLIAIIKAERHKKLHMIRIGDKESQGKHKEENHNYRTC